VAVPFANTPHPEEAVSAVKRTFIFWFVLCPSLRSSKGRACGSKEFFVCLCGYIENFCRPQPHAKSLQHTHKVIADGNDGKLFLPTLQSQPAKVYHITTA
jgi:hypothetical protein